MADEKHKHGPACGCPDHHHPNDDNRKPADEKLDPGSQALSDALRISFGVLKLVMLGVVVLFVWSGFFKVEQNQNALVLRFGKINGTGINAILASGWHWKWPDPIDEVVYLPIQEQILTADSFWYYQTDREKAGGQPGNVGSILQITQDGYSLTASQPLPPAGAEQTAIAGDNTMVDYNLVHTQWKLRYIIDNPLNFFNTLWNGRQKDYEQVDRFLRAALEDSVIRVSAAHDINWMLWRNDKELTELVLNLLRQRINNLNVGLRIEALDLVGRIVPRQVQDSFNLAAQADNAAGKMANEASAKAQQIINNAQAEASVMEAQARAYKSRIVQSAQGDARSLKAILQQINETVSRKVPADTAGYEQKRQAAFAELLAINMDQLYQETLRTVIQNADEVIVPSTAGDQTQWRIYLSRDPALKPNTAAPQPNP